MEPTTLFADGSLVGIDCQFDVRYILTGDLVTTDPPHGPLNGIVVGRLKAGFSSQPNGPDGRRKGPNPEFFVWGAFGVFHVAHAIHVSGRRVFAARKRVIDARLTGVVNRPKDPGVQPKGVSWRMRVVLGVRDGIQDIIRSMFSDENRHVLIGFHDVSILSGFRTRNYRGGSLSR
jgi:hypothetical protein